MSLSEERRLLQALAAGDRLAAEALVDETYGRVWALLCRLADGDRDLAADLAQETYRRAWAALGSFDGRARLSTWLYRIAYNVFFTHVARRRDVLPLDGQVTDRLADDGPQPEAAAALGERAALVHQAVLALPEELRQVVVARFFTDTPVAEIARSERVTPVAIRKRLRKALVLLGRAFEGRAP